MNLSSTASLYKMLIELYMLTPMNQIMESLYVTR
jgi:hypothetical protein